MTQTNKQKEALKSAIYLIEQNEVKNNHKWDDLWENGFNNSNALLVSLMDELESRSGFFAEKIIENKDYMPEKLVRYAGYMLSESVENCRRAEMLESIENLKNAIEKHVNYLQPFGKITQDKWEYLLRYCIEPLFDFE